MQKFSFAFVCCMILLFTACKKETLLETNQDLNPKKNLTSNTSAPATMLKDVVDAELDEADSLHVANLAMKEYKKMMLEATSSCFGPINGICGSPLIYHSCYYSYQIWNDPSKLYVDLYFPSSIIGWKTDCYGRTCQYYIAPCVSLDLFDANGAKIGSVNVASSSIYVSEKRISFDLNSLRTQYPTLKCVKPNGYFYIMKKCNNCYAQRVGTVCITQRQFCIQQCASACPTVSNVSLDKLKICGSGAVNGTVSITGDATKTITTWTVDGQTFTGNNVSIDFAANTSCDVITKNIAVRTTCTANQTVLTERSFNVQIHPVLSATVEVDNLYCQALIVPNCPSDLLNINWTTAGESGSGNIVNNISYQVQTLNYTLSNSGCSYNGSAQVECLPLLKKNTPKVTQ